MVLYLAALWLCVRKASGAVDPDVRSLRLPSTNFIHFFSANCTFLPSGHAKGLVHGLTNGRPRCTAEGTKHRHVALCSR